MNAETWKVCEELLRRRLEKIGHVSHWLRKQELPAGLIVHLVNGLTWPGTRREDPDDGKWHHGWSPSYIRASRANHGGLTPKADLIPDPSYMQLDRRGESLGSATAVHRIVTRVFREMEGDPGRFLVLLRQLAGIREWLAKWSTETNTKAALRAIVTEHVGDPEPDPEAALLAELALEGLS